MAKCDANLQESLEDLDKGVRAIVKRIEDLKGFSGAVNDCMKKEEVLR